MKPLISRTLSSLSVKAQGHFFLSNTNTAFHTDSLFSSTLTDPGSRIPIHFFQPSSKQCLNPATFLRVFLSILTVVPQSKVFRHCRPETIVATLQTFVPFLYRYSSDCSIKNRRFLSEHDD